MPQFDLSIHSFTAPTVPPTPDELPSTIRPSDIPGSSLAVTSPLQFSILLPFARDNKKPLFPATHLQLAYIYPGTGSNFTAHYIKNEDLVASELDNVYRVEVAPDEVPRDKVNHGQSSTVEVMVYAWKGEKLLGKWLVGEVPDLAIEGFKSSDFHIARAEARRDFLKSSSTTSESAIAR